MKQSSILPKLCGILAVLCLCAAVLASADPSVTATLNGFQYSSIILTLASAAAVTGFLCLYLRSGGNVAVGFAAVPVGFALSLLFCRFLHWYAHEEAYSSLWSAMTDYTTGDYILLGCFPACMIAALLTRDAPKALDCISLAGGSAITVGRLSALFNASSRGQVIDSPLPLPWVCPVTNAVSGIVEERLATFLLQAAITSIITAVLLRYYLKRSKHYQNGDTALLFLLCYCAGQIVLDSTRYDSVYFRSNGFVSIVQVCCAVTMLGVIVVFSMRSVKFHRLRLWHLLLWGIMAILLALAGYMEYFVQRHGDQALLGYSLMSLCLAMVTAASVFIHQYKK